MGCCHEGGGRGEVPLRESGLRRLGRRSRKVFLEESLDSGAAVPDPMVYASQVALQFPDQLLGDAGAVAARLEEVTGSKMFILGDTAYGRWELA